MAKLIDVYHIVQTFRKKNINTDVNSGGPPFHLIVSWSLIGLATFFSPFWWL